MNDFVLRAARPDDAASLLALATSSADTGAIRAAPRYLRNVVDAWAALKPELEWVVAEARAGIVGAAQVVSGETEVEGQRFRSAVLTSLMVHPDHRRRGVARALTDWRLRQAGDDAVILAAIQTGNEASLANARNWATQIFGKLVLPVVRVEPGFTAGERLEIREPLDADEWDAAAAGLASFEQGWNFRTPETGTTLEERANLTLEGRRLQRYYVAVEAGRVTGGFELFESARIQSVVIERLPLALRAVNVFLCVVPRDGELRQNSVSRFWWRQDRDDVGRTLWSYARSVAAESGNAVGTQFDVRSPLTQLLKVRAWTPKGTLAVAVRSPIPLDEDRLLSPP